MPGTAPVSHGRTGRIVRLAALFGLSAACVAPVASADTSTTQTLPPGAVASTGPEATKADPLQALVRLPRGGTVTITKVSDPAPTKILREDAIRRDRIGPGIDITPPKGEFGPGSSVRLPVAIIVDGSLVPRLTPGTDLNRMFDLDQTLDGEPSVLRDKNATSRLLSVTRLANGDYRVAFDMDASLERNSGEGGEFGSRVSLTIYRAGFHAPTAVRTASSTGDGVESLGSALRRGIAVENPSMWACVVSIKLSVSKRAAKKLGLKRKTLLSDSVPCRPYSGSNKGTPFVKFPRKVRRALAKFNRVSLKVTAVAKPQAGLGAKPSRQVSPRTLVLQREDELS